MKYFDYKEDKQHGTSEFPIEFYHVTPNHPRYTMPYHWHTECEIIRIISGEFSLIINEEKFTAHKDDLIFINDGYFHGGTPTNCIYECIVFDMNSLLKTNNYCKNLLHDIITHKKLINTKLSSQINDIQRACNYLFESINFKNPGYEFITLGALYFLIGSIIKYDLYISNNKVTQKTKERIMQFKNTLLLIENNYSEHITLEYLSKSSGMTPKYFCRFFHEMSGKTPIEYLNYYRIEIACELLLNGDSNITEIAFSCGFNDVSYFIKTFKKFKRITPKQYLKSLHFL
ncbi:AraC family transcriptional regulator [Clostridium butyricum]|uniref:Transcriptional regulator, AraC family n=1 Tax=Clostridium butyricum E4 str. BoNT E BL5262 TaxID=632245 RepID=C4ILU1_CLOBU|nr:AraC family transcriptional regulator [Clostridium butyricum]APF22866.1 helix-turn-helix domain protein [Clostridium butyricum]EDT74623.1 transcriptional regulator, AraC family [Clostridium butyricum 5521]EEP52679.1 transcriptional regulator, AraC family [Clostridium butyricum E4 str. BoNT E BL5262]NFL29911.1 helix-turn-helix domain-containing protein [Clostridium butyricum]NFS17482.1 helix-turn-helix domain-containing protein [Clostridium butyricum]